MKYSSQANNSDLIFFGRRNHPTHCRESIHDFIGLEEFTGKPAFDSSLFVYIRKRMNVESINEMSLVMMEAECRKSGESEEMKAISRIKKTMESMAGMTVLSIKETLTKKEKQRNRNHHQDLSSTEKDV